MRDVVFTQSATRALARLDVELRGLILAAIALYAESGAGDVRELRGRPGLRIRVGEHRVLCERDRRQLTVTDVGHRSTIYTR